MAEKRAVVLLSGGLDSATVVAIAQEQGFDVQALSFSYGQRHDVELEAAKRVAAHAGVDRHVVAQIDLRVFGGSALTDEGIDVPKNSEDDGIPVTYVPARNTIFLSFALAFAETTDADDVFIGVNAVDYSGYPDCRPEYIDAFQEMARLATQRGVEGHPVRIHAPLSNLSKAEIISRGIALGVDYGITHSCYDPAPDGAACGACDSCKLRLAGFAANGIADPAPYVQRAAA
jgi:7-cyano-7-deazaguanine synthase